MRYSNRRGGATHLSDDGRGGGEGGGGGGGGGRPANKTGAEIEK